MAACATADVARAAACRDGVATAYLKAIVVFTIFFTSMAGMSLPILLAQWFHRICVYDTALLLIKCFDAGVILTTSLVHVFLDAFSAFSDCHVASRHPRKDFPFAGLVTPVGVLAALLVDAAAGSHAEHVQYAPVEVSGEEKVLIIFNRRRIQIVHHQVQEHQVILSSWTLIS